MRGNLSQSPLISSYGPFLPLHLYPSMIMTEYDMARSTQHIDSTPPVSPGEQTQMQMQTQLQLQWYWSIIGSVGLGWAGRTNADANANAVAVAVVAVVLVYYRVGRVRLGWHTLHMYAR